MSPFLFGLLALLASAALQAADSVRYCDYPVYPPVSWSDGKQPRGLAPTVVRELFGRLGYRVEMVVLGNWQRCLLDAAEGRVDVVLAYASEQRAKSMRFSQVPVLREEVAVFANRQHPLQFDQLEDLARYRGGLLFGESYGQAFDRFVAQHQNIEWVSDSGQNFGKLIRGRIDFVVQERRTGQLFVEHLAGAQDIVALPPALSVDYLRVAVSRHSPLSERMGDIDAQLQKMVDAGELERWLHESEVTYRDMVNQP
ncbi:transporter substrate-binding domain-containing protein [Pseudomonas vlassakiae]|uniref:substrate-binding periplasmic protein n=1 Tax=Pseudomonas TaxID=286 RepID=UPI0006D41CA1|nr:MULTISPECIES: transporter substrate-binding domain-containing protein [Pseudomonas]MBS3185664.1 transporter substrate-binding domain-containing protein [Pseudomonas sp. PCH44]MCU0122946.1 transporter substrate-binding domain-containing protein [Pseudomonas vlassakiae]PIK80379.1 amino acid ABC transporter substrate-binding protein [Pseudomonas sp. 382]HCV41397.1 amino acid ABC transporter substrate-binding protein [Pseudomonas sp.]